MSDFIRSLMQDRAGLIADARGILDAADAEERTLTQEETNGYDALMDKVTTMAANIQRREQQMNLERDLAAPVTEPADRGEPGEREDQAYQFVSRGLRALNEDGEDWGEQAEWRNIHRSMGPLNVQAFRRWLRNPESKTWASELRALQVDSDILGGYLTPPVQFVDRLIQAVDNLTFIRQWANVIAVPNADSLGVVSLDNDPADPTWTSELKIGSEDSTMSFGKRELKPHPLAEYIKASRTLLRKVPAVESLVIARLAYKFGVTMENAYLNGPGSGEPLGVFTASDDGISTGRDVSTDMTTTAMTFDGLKEVKYTLKGQYWGQARWLFHRDGIKQIAKLKNGDGQYIWAESVRVGEPDRCLNFPIFMSEYAPNTFTTGLYVGILGAFDNYWIADALNLDFQRLDELFAATNQVGFVGRMESDGLPVLEEAFVRVTLA